ncbi:DUF305 domain-containing protein [Pyrinomonas sp.]|uniref:DUF305 domain-containing protein n=1 Tax=Pyrinomonas sp. TaxID=2080306 RepID=UPI0033260064
MREELTLALKEVSAKRGKKAIRYTMRVWRWLMFASAASLIVALTACGTEPAKINGNRTAAQNEAANQKMSHGGSQDSHATMDHAQMQSSPGAEKAPYDLQFIDTMIAHHQGAIDMARLAADRAERGELKELARKIIADQEREIAQMRQWRERWYKGQAPAMNMDLPGMRESMQMDMGKLAEARGRVFDLLFIDMMIPHHEGAVKMSRQALERAEHVEVRRLAEQIIAAQQAEIAQMRQWRAEWEK